MKKMKLGLFAFFCFCAIAPSLAHAKARYVAEFGAGIGYRADEFRYKIQDSDTGVLFASEQSDGFLSTVPIGAHFKADIDAFRLTWEGLYGWLLPTPTVPAQVSLTSIIDEYGWLGPGEVYWVDQARNMWSATITIKDGQPDVSAPKQMLADHPLDKNSIVLAYDPARERFLIATEDESQEEPRLIIVSDWRTDAPRAKPAP